MAAKRPGSPAQKSSLPKRILRMMHPATEQENPSENAAEAFLVFPDTQEQVVVGENAVSAEDAVPESSNSIPIAAIFVNAAPVYSVPMSNPKLQQDT
ncbi:hypothetical protein PRK78_003097 [Emydomyces testavorans]|uniref:Uncharacterized protein n=1 Tax=Emydomyces testavorans TaxID=2070801 RepID=A0AAF0DFI7_9EURO|nr:hypothetical protein PRK78_003097 [Emydomyces testavorans]